MPYYIGKQAELEQLERLKANWIKQRAAHARLALEGKYTPEYAYHVERVKICEKAIKSLTDQIFELKYRG